MIESDFKHEFRFLKSSRVLNRSTRIFRTCEGELIFAVTQIYISCGNRSKELKITKKFELIEKRKHIFVSTGIVSVAHSQTHIFITNSIV